MSSKVLKGYNTSHYKRDHTENHPTGLLLGSFTNQSEHY